MGLSENCDLKHSASVTTHDEVRVDHAITLIFSANLPTLLPLPARLKVKIPEDNELPEQQAEQT